MDLVYENRSGLTYIFDLVLALRLLFGTYYRNFQVVRHADQTWIDICPYLNIAILSTNQSVSKTGMISILLIYL